MAVIRAAHDNMYGLGQSPADRRAQTVTVTMAFSLTVIMLCLFTRLYMRWPWSNLLSTNDFMALAATLFAIGQGAATAVAVSHNFAHPMEDVSKADIATIRQSLLVGKLLFYLSAAFASMAVVEFIIQLKAQVKIWLVDYVVRMVTPVWGLAGLIVSAVFLGLSTTSEPAAAEIVLAVIGCLIQLATFTAAVLITKDLQTDRLTKTRVLLGFSPCFLVVAAFIVSCAVVPTNLYADQFTTRDVNYIITLQCILLFAIIYATTPALLQIGKRFQTGYGAPVIDENHNTMSGSLTTSRNRHQRTDNDSFGLKSFGNQQVVSSISAHDRLDRDQYRAHSEKPRRDRSVKKATLGDDADERSVASDSSRKIIISKSVTQSSVNI